ncbi:MAG: type I-B CRISPR-associated protein Cas8b1/Cst1 [Clostridia bacterium]
MNLRVYLGDWMINAGIIGFIRIIDDTTLIHIKDNYIEFDSDILYEFDNYYFDYYFNKYDICKKVKNKVSTNIEYIKIKPDKFKDGIKYIKDEFKTQSKKIEKIDTDTYNQMKNIIEQISVLNTIEQIDKLQINIDEFLKLLSKQELNRKLTLDLWKNKLSGFYGQNSFLNVSFNKLAYEEQKSIMYRDYISKIVESAFFNEYIDGNKSFEEFKEHMVSVLEDKNISDSTKWYSVIQKKYIDKGKTEEEIKKYIKDNIFSSCTLCGSETINTDDYTEGNYIPLAMSTQNAINFFYNQNNKMPICELCKLIMFCIEAGQNTISKVSREIDKGQICYKKNTIYNFINYDTDVNTLLNINDNFTKKAQIQKKESGFYSEMILDIISQNKKTSLWELENIFIVEIDSKYREYSRIEYFNIQKYVANFFVNYAQKTLINIKNANLKIEITDCILKNKSIGQAIVDNTKNCIISKKGVYSNPYDSFLAAKINLYLKLLKKGGNTLEDKNKKLNVLYNIGIEIHEKLARENSENKLNEYAYKLLNSINLGDNTAFMDIVIRLHMSIRKDVSQIFLDVMRDGELDFESIGHSFVSGLISNRYNKDNINKSSNVENSSLKREEL